MSSLVLRDVSLKAPSSNSTEAPRRKWILRDIDLAIPAGTVFTVLGPSGSGKTSLLRLMNRLHDPTSGEILFDGKPLQSFDPTALRRAIGYIFQVPTMLPGTVADNLAYGAAPGRLPRRGALPDRAAMAQRLEQVALDASYLDQPAGRLSVGEQQRVSIARSLMTSPAVLLMDEPTSALDPSATARLLDLIADLLNGRQLTIVFVTHQLEQARTVGRHTAILIDGRIVETGPTSDVFASPQTDAARRFLSGRSRPATDARSWEAAS